MQVLASASVHTASTTARPGALRFRPISTESAGFSPPPPVVPSRRTRRLPRRKGQRRKAKGRRVGVEDTVTLQLLFVSICTAAQRSTAPVATLDAFVYHYLTGLPPARFVILLSCPRHRLLHLRSFFSFLVFLASHSSCSLPSRRGGHCSRCLHVACTRLETQVCLCMCVCVSVIE